MQHKMPEPLVYIIIINWNRWKDTLECLDSVFRSTYSHYRVIVCDNGSTDGSLEKIKAWADGELVYHTPVGDSAGQKMEFAPNRPQPLTYVEWTPQELAELQERNLESLDIILIRLRDNWGFGKANNVALRLVSRDKQLAYAWLLNNDTVIYPNTLALMVQAAQRHSGITGSVLKYYTDPSKIQVNGGGYFNPTTGRVTTEQQTKSQKLDFINGASLMLSKAVIDNVGLFDEQIFMYFEENDYCIRAQKQGFTMAVADAFVLHKGGASSGGDNSYWSWQNVYTNKCYVLLKHYGKKPWILFSIGAWLFNILNPRVLPAKRQASKYAIVYLIKALRTGLR